MGKTIAICNQKGGVGKTTTAINLAACLAQAGKHTLLLDIDPQANATSGMGINKQGLEHSIYHVLLGEHTFETIAHKTAIHNMDLVPADMQLNGAQIELVSAFNREQRLKQSIATVKHNYDFVLIDCPPSLGLLTINALTAADTILIPLQCEYYAMEGLSQLLQTIKLVQDHLNPQLAIEGVVLTMADYRTKLTNEVIAEAQRFFDNKVYKSIIPRSIRLSEAPGHGMPVVLYDRHSNGAIAYQQLAAEVIHYNLIKDIEIKQNIQTQGNHSESATNLQTASHQAHAEDIIKPAVEPSGDTAQEPRGAHGEA
jgi:chromosome partitioning protein